MPDADRACLMHRISFEKHEGCTPPLEIFERHPRATIEFLIEHMNDRVTLVADYQTSRGQQACGLLHTILDRSLGGVSHYILGREEQNRKAVEAWQAWFAENRDKPIRDWFWGLEWREFQRVRGLLARHPNDWRADEIPDRRAVPYLIEVALASSQYAFLDKDVWRLKWQLADQLLIEITKHRVEGRTMEELQKGWKEWWSIHKEE